jgi:hypothetical protein
MKYSKGYLYQVKERIAIDTPIRTDSLMSIQGFVSLDEHGRLMIERGYAWNGNTLFIDTENNMFSSLVHDAIYQLIQEGELDIKYKPAADRLLRDLMIEHGSWKATAYLFYYAVAIFGRIFVKNQKKIYEV